ncbi:MAG TPA: glycerate kinase [Nocardioidaceae bacterium]|nr:glycerate kinase [Nocardioidaceae bacterium]
MRVLIAPDKFAGTLTAPQAAEAMATGWQRRAPQDECISVPMSDGGPGFVDVLHTALGGDVLALTVRGPLGDEVPGAVLLREGTAYIESAQAAGSHLIAPTDSRPEQASSYGAGEMIAAAVDAGARRLVVGLGGSATTDGGAGLLAALGADADVPLDAGPAGLDGVSTVDLTGVRERLGMAEVVIASDVDSPLLGLFGTAKVFGPQKGLTEERIVVVDAILDRFVEATLGSTPAQRRLADAAGAGAAGGMGFALLLLAASRVPGVALVAEAVGLPALARQCDVVLTGEGSFDFSSRAGKVVHGVAEISQAALRPCVVLAGRVLVGAREMRALGIESAYSLVDLVGEQAAFVDPADSLATLAERTARTWSHP